VYTNRRYLINVALTIYSMTLQFNMVRLCWLRLLRTVGGLFEHGSSCCAPLWQTFVDLGMSPLCESYLTLSTAEHIFAAHGMRLINVEEQPAHDGSLRHYACHQENGDCAVCPQTQELKSREDAEGFGEKVMDRTVHGPRYDDVTRSLVGK
jgi:hypothetical protein